MKTAVLAICTLLSLAGLSLAEDSVKERAKDVKIFADLANAMEKAYGKGPKAILSRRVANDVQNAAASAEYEQFLAALKKADFDLQQGGIFSGGPKPSSSPRLPAGVEPAKTGKNAPLEVRAN